MLEDYFEREGEHRKREKKVGILREKRMGTTRGKQKNRGRNGNRRRNDTKK